ncbi:MAG: pyridoxamine 5'-phosphate oxidase [Candidatus Sericytochromatia bacterium]
MELHDYRKDYQNAPLLEENIDKNPFKQFEIWFKEAEKAGVYEPNAFNLATCNKNGDPSCRVVLLKEFSEDGFIFFTNYESKKASDILENPNVAINFFWAEIHRQVRISGKVEKISLIKSEEYFRSRPVGSQIGAIASKQSHLLLDRNELDLNYKALEEKYTNEIIPMPNNWGGYIVKPTYFEFWQGRSSRLHDRIVFEKVASNWNISRLYP